ncbi:hypothetical protein D3C80_1340220 [compost metagenome]
MGKAGDAVDDEKNIVALIAKMFGNGDRGKRRHLAQHRAFIAGGDNGDGLAHVFAHRVFDELAHFASAFADQRNHHLVEGVGLGEHRQQRGFAHTGAGKNTEALPEAQRREDIDCPHAGLERRLHPLARH